MNYVKQRIKDIYLGATSVENIFLNELMPAAPGDFVKVYLTALLHAETGHAISDQALAEHLGLTVDRLAEAWNYWEECGAVRKHYQDSNGRFDYTVEFLSVREQLYGDGLDVPEETPEAAPAVDVFGDPAIQTFMRDLELKLGHTLSRTEMETVLGWLQDQSMPLEVIRQAVSYSLERDKKNFRYIARVVEGWADQGLKTPEAVRQHLRDNDQKYGRSQRVMRALGFSRAPTEAEREMMDAWFDQMGFNMDKVLEACAKTAGIANPNIKYVNSVLEGWKGEAEKAKRDVNERRPVSAATLNRYYDYLRGKAEKEAEQRRAEVYRRIPEIEKIDRRTKELGSLLSRALIMGDEGDGRKLNEEMEQLAEDRAILLTENDYDMDYTDVRYLCPLCGDTGVTDMGERCKCINERMLEAEEWQRRNKRGKKESI
ncbi:MAG: DnaD domain protein [Firmicutes bacterium]|nr:DnaD domain protein [Bacillota bacterium]MCR4710964.1 DnaD domain protein [Clostridia bacterium]